MTKARKVKGHRHLNCRCEWCKKDTGPYKVCLECGTYEKKEKKRG